MSTEIQEAYPTFQFEPGFKKHDQLWDPLLRETALQVRSRLQRFLEDIFEHDRNTFISLTTHSGALSGLLSAINHRPFRLETGGVLAVVVKAERLS